MASDSPKPRPHSRRRRFWRFALWTGGLLGVGAFVLLHIGAAHMAKYDDPARLNGNVHTLETNGFALRWIERRNTSATADVVFIHGSPGGAGVWATQFADPVSNANYFAYNRPGFGASTPTLSQPHLQMQVAALMQLIAAADVHRPILVGHSYGGPIALLAAVQHPDKVRGALLIGGDVDPAEEKPWLVQYLLGWRLTAWLLPQPLRQSNREMLTARADLLELQKQLPNLQVPVAMLHGVKDPLVPVANVGWLAEELSSAGKTNLFTSMVYSNYNHFIPWEEPEAVQAAIRSLLEPGRQP